MNCRFLAFLSLCCALAASAQHPTSDRIVLPANKTDAEVTLLLRTEPAKAAKVSILPLVDSKGAPLSPQPVIAEPVLRPDEMQLHLSAVYFWGEAKLQVQVPSGPEPTYTLQRGPTLASSDVHVGRRNPAELWLYNFDTQPLKLRWRIVSGADSVCGIESNGQPRRDCASLDRWSEATLGPARSDVILFAPPDAWFDPWKALCDKAVRQAQIELRFGTDDTAPLLRVPLKLHIDVGVSDAFALWIPSWVASTLNIVGNLLWVTLWVTLGAVLLMLAQVMIPNFRKCLRMEDQIEALQERLRAISSRVGTRLSTRCYQEIQNVREGLAMGQTATKSSGQVSTDWASQASNESGGQASTKSGGQASTKSGIFSGLFDWKRLALAGNTADVSRLASILARIESRLHLTERLDECESAALDAHSGDMPPSHCWNQAMQIRNVQRILSSQFIDDVDEKSASSSLDLLADAAAALKEFATELEKRITGIRRQLTTAPWKAKCVDLIVGLNGCAELLQGIPPTVPDGGWNSDELILRDLATVRLEIVTQMIALESLLTDNKGAKDEILMKLRSTDPDRLAAARVDLLKLSQGIYEEHVQAALEEGMWDACFEPTTVTYQDVLRGSLVLRNKDLNRCEAKNSFKCYWRISFEGPDAVTGDDVYEEGWETQFIPPRGNIKVTPEIYDSHGKEVNIQRSTIPGKPKGVTMYQVAPPTSNTPVRLIRGIVDASITALVPVITVALTQLQNGGGLSVDKLVLLGFTSQAIRAAVLPESVSATPETQPAKPTSTDTRA